MDGAILCLNRDVAVTDFDSKVGAAILQSQLFAGRAKAAYTDVLGCKLLSFCMLLWVRFEQLSTE